MTRAEGLLFLVYGTLLFMKREILALLKLSNGLSTLAYHKVSHLSIKDTFKHIEHCVYLSGIFDFLLELNGWPKCKVSSANVWNNPLLMTNSIPDMLTLLYACQLYILTLWKELASACCFFSDYAANHILASYILLYVSTPFATNTGQIG